MDRSCINHRIAQLQHPLLQLAQKLTKDPVDAMDLFQETALRAVRKSHLYKDVEGSNLKAWLKTIMRNIFINNYRQKRKKNTFYDITENTHIINSLNPSANRGENHLLMEELKAILNKLDDDKKTPFIMHYKGYSYNEIAEKLDLPLGTIKSKIFYARKEMKRDIQHKYGERPVLC